MSQFRYRGLEISAEDNIGRTSVCRILDRRPKG